MRVRLSPDFRFGRNIPMIVLVVVSVFLPLVTILTCVGWGWRHGTLTETPQDHVDWDFERIVNRI